MGRLAAALMVFSITSAAGNYVSFVRNSHTYTAKLTCSQQCEFLGMTCDASQAEALNAEERATLLRLLANDCETLLPRPDSRLPWLDNTGKCFVMDNETSPAMDCDAVGGMLRSDTQLCPCVHSQDAVCTGQNKHPLKDECFGLPGGSPKSKLEIGELCRSTGRGTKAKVRSKKHYLDVTNFLKNNLTIDKAVHLDSTPRWKDIKGASTIPFQLEGSLFDSEVLFDLNVLSVSSYWSPSDGKMHVYPGGNSATIPVPHTALCRDPRRVTFPRNRPLRVGFDMIPGCLTVPFAILETAAELSSHRCAIRCAANIVCFGFNWKPADGMKCELLGTNYEIETAQLFTHTLPLNETTPGCVSATVRHWAAFYNPAPVV